MSSFLSFAAIAVTTHAALKEEVPSEEAQAELATMGIEVLRETLQQIAVEQTCLERQMAVDFVKHVLLYVKGLLLQWDVDNFPAPAGIDLPIPKMPQTFPNQCWSVRHPRRDIFVEDIRAGLQCLRRYKAFTGEPWLWLQDFLESMLVLLSDSH